MNKFDGWVMIAQVKRGVLLQTNIEALDTHREELPLCETTHIVARSARYSLASPESATELCEQCVKDLVDGAGTTANGGCYVVGALPAN